MDELFDLYQEIILDHNKRPRNFHALETATHRAEGNNPLCGDQLQVFLELQDNRIRNVSFWGEGCAISKASASLMTMAVKGKPVDEVEQILGEVLSMLTGSPDTPVALDEFGDIASLSGVRQFPVRIKCATLAWHALDAAMDGKKAVSTE
jgi:nitrogen fixation NifU-like protein